MPECFLSGDDVMLQGETRDEVKNVKLLGMEKIAKTHLLQNLKLGGKNSNHEMSQRHEVGKVCPRYVISNTVDVVDVGKVRYFATRDVCLVQVSQEKECRL